MKYQYTLFCNAYCADPVSGWISLGAAPSAGAATLSVEYNVARDLEMVVTNWDPDRGNYIFDNQTVLPVPVFCGELPVILSLIIGLFILKCTNKNREVWRMNLIKMFENATDVEEYLAGMTILEEGKPGDCMYVVLEGKVEIRVGDRPIDTAAPGEIVGEMALIDSMARSASAVALTDCKLTPINEKQFLFLVQRTPLFSLHVMRVLADRIRKMDDKM